MDLNLQLKKAMYNKRLKDTPWKESYDQPR